MDIVKRRYNDARKICDDYIAQILDLPKMETRSAAGILNITSVLTLTLHGLKRYQYDTSSWAKIIVTCVTRKLDAESRQKFEESLEDNRKVPTILILMDFLDRRYKVILNDGYQPPAASRKKAFAAVTEDNSHAPEKHSRACPMCNGNDHNLRQCGIFIKLSPSQRIQFAKSKKLCLNCLGNHENRCSSRFTCLACRGKHPLWWHGPAWLSNVTCATDLEQRPFSTLAHLVTAPSSANRLDRYSSFSHSVRVTAWIWQFKQRALKRTPFINGGLKASELPTARNMVIRLLQKQDFAEEYKCLQKNQSPPKNSRISTLNPYIDESELIR